LCRLSCQQYGHKACLGHRPVKNGVAGPYKFITFSAAEEISKQIASACAGLGLKRCDKIGVLGINCPQWMLAMQVTTACKAALLLCCALCMQSSAHQTFLIQLRHAAADYTVQRNTPFSCHNVHHVTQQLLSCRTHVLDLS
jgi:long-subunit acyl-CoA synthetase (AMP-forming)